MQKTHRLLTTAAAASLYALTGAAFAQTAATATTDLNLRAGPGPEHAVVGSIPANGAVSIGGCIEGSKWCQVTYEGAQGWAYSDYLVADLSGAPVVITERRADVGVPVVTYEASGAEAGGAAGATAGVAGGAIVGALVGGPVGAVVGGVAGAAAGAIAGTGVGAAVDPPEQVLTYVAANPAPPVFLEGEVVLGAGVPEPVELRPVPESQYVYATVNGQPVLVDPTTRQIVYVVR